jgi:glycosyltransferase involved in cell wall biosynthesis
MHVQLIIEAEIASTQLIEQVLRACGPAGLTYEKRLLSDLRRHHIATGDVPLFVRCADPVARWWADRLGKAGHPYLYYVDDHFWRLSWHPTLGPYYDHPAVRESLDGLVRGAAAVVVHSPLLADFLRDRNPRIRIVPQSFDFSLVDGVVAGGTHDEIRIGFAGNASRAGDLDVMRIVVPAVLRDCPRAVFEFAGVMPPGVAVSDRVRFLPYVDDYRAYIRLQVSRGWAIGLAPLLDTESNRAKTNTKYREYGACHIAGIYAAIPPYVGSVESDRTGWLVGQTADEWVAAIRALVGDPARRRAMGQAAYEHVWREHRLPIVAAQWSAILGDLAAAIQQAPPRPIPPLSARQLAHVAGRRLQLGWRKLLTLPAVRREARRTRSLSGASR